MWANKLPHLYWQDTNADRGQCSFQFSLSLSDVLLSSSDVTVHVEQSLHCVMTQLHIAILIHLSYLHPHYKASCVLTVLNAPTPHGGVRIHLPDAFSECQYCPRFPCTNQMTVSAPAQYNPGTYSFWTWILVNVWNSLSPISMCARQKCCMQVKTLWTWVFTFTWLDQLPDG